MNRYTQNGTTLHDANEVRYGGTVRGYGGTVRWYAGTLKTARPYTTLMRYGTEVRYEGTVVRYGGTLVHSKRHDPNEVRHGGTVRGYGGRVRAYGGTVAWWYGGTVACRWLSWRCCLLSCVNIGQNKLQPSIQSRGYQIGKTNIAYPMVLFDTMAWKILATYYILLHAISCKLQAILCSSTLSKPKTLNFNQLSLHRRIFSCQDPWTSPAK